MLTPEQKAAYINAQTAAMLAELESMKALNYERAQNRFALAYDEKAFSDLPENYGLTHNQVLKFFQEG